MPLKDDLLKSIPWTSFRGLDTELSAPTIPEGLSPDCQDVAFMPGDVFTRPGLQKLFAAAFGPIGGIYSKSFVQPGNDTLNFYLTSDGIMHLQDVTSGTASSVLFTVVAVNNELFVVIFSLTLLTICNLFIDITHDM